MLQLLAQQKNLLVLDDQMGLISSSDNAKITVKEYIVLVWVEIFFLYITILSLDFLVEGSYPHLCSP